MSEQNQLAERPQSVKDFLALPAYRDRFHEVMGKRANQFMAAITAVSQLPGLKDSDPRSVIAAAMVAATLDLPVNPTLGQAHIVAYAGGDGRKVAQFQIGYKGLIQLALRSGQYRRLNAGPLSAGAFKGYDAVGEPVLDFSQNDPSKEAAGYYCAFETLNGFIKVVYWSREQAEAHGKRFSKAYAKGYSTPWKSDFDSMATKTVIKAALGKWGLLSVEMQKAVVHDQGAQEDVDADVKYVDGEESTAGEGEQPEPPKRPPAPRKAKGAATVIDVPHTEPEAPKEAPPPDQPKAEQPPQSFTEAAAATPPVEPEAAKAPEKPADPAPQPTPSTVTAVPGQPRAFLSDGEEITCEVTATEVAGTFIKKNGTPNPGVKATLKGGYNGDVYHLTGGTASGEDVIPNKPWEKGAKLMVTLRGELSAKTGRVIPFVQKVEGVEEEF